MYVYILVYSTCICSDIDIFILLSAINFLFKGSLERDCCFVNSLDQKEGRRWEMASDGDGEAKSDPP